MGSQWLTYKTFRYRRDLVVRQGFVEAWLWKGVQIIAEMAHVNSCPLQSTCPKNEYFLN